MMYPANSPFNPWKSYTEATANAEPLPDVRAVRGFWSGRFGVILGTVTAVIVITAIALAVVAPLSASQVSATPPAGFTQVYDAGLSDDGTWTDTAPCTFTSQGLDVTGGTLGTACTFRPSTSGDVTSQGFWIQATVAPAASLQNNEVPVILVGKDEPVLIDSQGAYIIYCNNDNTNANTPCATGTTTAWHTNEFVANTITVSYDAGAATLTVFVNDQVVTSAPFTQGSQPTLALGAGGDGEAIFTHVSIYSANASAHGARS